MMAAPVQQEEPCTLANERDRERMPSNKLQSAMYYALDGDQVNILTMLAQKCEDFWVTIRIIIPNLFLYEFFWILFLECGIPFEETSPARSV